MICRFNIHIHHPSIRNLVTTYTQRMLNTQFYELSNCCNIQGRKTHTETANLTVQKQITNVHHMRGKKVAANDKPRERLGGGDEYPQ